MSWRQLRSGDDLSSESGSLTALRLDTGVVDEVDFVLVSLADADVAAAAEAAASAAATAAAVIVAVLALLTEGLSSSFFFAELLVLPFAANKFDDDNGDADDKDDFGVLSSSFRLACEGRETADEVNGDAEADDDDDDGVARDEAMVVVVAAAAAAAGDADDEDGVLDSSSMEDGVADADGAPATRCSGVSNWW